MSNHQSESISSSSALRVDCPPGAQHGWIAEAQDPRQVTTGGKINPKILINQTAHIDWLSLTVTPPDDYGLDWLWPYLRALLAIPSMQQIEKLGKWNGYTTVFDLGGAGLLGIGGESQKGTIHVSISGIGCARISDWQALHDWMQSIRVRITRVDLAHDDFDGKILSINNAVQWYRDGLFNTGGRKPQVRNQGDWINSDDGKGRTLYIGLKSSGKMACIYEKGKQLGDPSSLWTRAEVRLGGKSRVIPLDVLIRPGDYLAGAYPCIAYLSTKQDKVLTMSKVSTMTLASTIHHLRQTGGKAINLLHDLYHCDDAKVVKLLAREGYPARLAQYVDFLPEVLDKSGEST
jgi:phage replication initiation protein